MSKNKINQPAEQKIVKKAWTPQENETLLKAVANKGNLSLNDVFVNFGIVFYFVSRNYQKHENRNNIC